MSTTDLWALLANEARTLERSLRELPVIAPTTPAETRQEVERRFSLERAVPLDRLLPEVGELLRRRTVHVIHPRYFGLFNPSVREAGVAGEALAAVFNAQLAAWSHAPAANEIERLTLRQLGTVLGFASPGCVAHFTSGGAEANFTAVQAALARCYPEAAEAGQRALPRRPALYLSAEAHHSFVKIARMSGLGTEAVRMVPVDARLSLDVAALNRAIAADRERGFEPLMVVATVGTTGAGACDPIAELAEVAEAHGAWLHVDGAWGATAALSPRLRGVLAGIERARSATWDAHKWLSVPMGAGMFFCRDADAVARAFAISTSYMPRDSGEDFLDPYTSTVQWSRRFIGLKVFLALAELGLDGYRALVERQADLGDRLRQQLQDRGWILANDTSLPVICFTHHDLREGRVSTSALLKEIYRRGRIWISDVVVGGRERVLRACITSFRTTEDDLEVLVEEVEAARRASLELTRGGRAGAG